MSAHTHTHTHTHTHPFSRLNTLNIRFLVFRPHPLTCVTELRYCRLLDVYIICGYVRLHCGWSPQTELSTCNCHLFGNIVCGFARLRCKLNYVTVTFCKCCPWLRGTTSQTELCNCRLLTKNKKALCLVWCSLFPWTRNRLLSFYGLKGFAVCWWHTMTQNLSPSYLHKNSLLLYFLKYLRSKSFAIDCNLCISEIIRASKFHR